jgi:carboxyl-terminal processing protease
MNRLIKYFLFGFGFITVGLLVGFKIQTNIPEGGGMTLDRGIKKFQDALFFIERNYIKETDTEKIVDDAIQGVMEGLDPHSFYIPVSEMNQMKEQMGGEFEGIGIEFNLLDDTIYVVTPLSGGPSEALGIMAGDRIVKVDGENVAGVNITNTEVMRKLKGPKGTKVSVSIWRKGVRELIRFDIIRDKIPLHSVSYSYMVEPETGYMQITRFSETTYDEFREHLDKLMSQGMENLILDLRGNPGGYMSMAQRIADDFLSPGQLVVSTIGRVPESNQMYKSTSVLNAFEKGGLVVMIDYGSASASEIVSGAVQDHDRGLIVGVRSYGKGLVQIQKEFDDGSAIRLVVSEYHTPSGRCIQKPYEKSAEEYELEILERFESGEIYDESKIKIPDSLKYKTDSGRTVYGGGGIYPDIFVAPDTTGRSKYLTDLQINDMFRGFSLHYVDNHPELEAKYMEPASFISGFNVTPSLAKEFTDYADSREVAFDVEGYKKSQRIVDNRIKAFIGRKLFQDDGFYPVLHDLDNMLRQSVELMPVARKLEKTGKLKLANN